MQKKEFERQMGEPISLPDADTTAALYRFGLECGRDDMPNLGPEELLARHQPPDHRPRRRRGQEDPAKQRPPDDAGLVRHF